MCLRHSLQLLSLHSRFYSYFFGSLYGGLDDLWIDQRSFDEPVTDAGAMSTTSDPAEHEEVYFLCTFWDAVGTHCFQERTVG